MGYLTNKKIEDVLEKGIHTDGDGLRLRVGENKNKSWILRYRFSGQTREMGLGKYPIVSLKDARKKTQEARKQKINDRNTENDAGNSATKGEVAQVDATNEGY